MSLGSGKNPLGTCFIGCVTERCSSGATFLLEIQDNNSINGNAFKNPSG